MTKDLEADHFFRFKATYKGESKETVYSHSPSGLYSLLSRFGDPEQFRIYRKVNDETHEFEVITFKFLTELAMYSEMPE